MSPLDVVRAWKDEEYRLGLGDHERAMLPENPAGLMELSDETLEQIAGAANQPQTSVICSATILACATAALSCWPSCNATVVGTCKWFTAGCC